MSFREKLKQRVGWKSGKRVDSAPVLPTQTSSTATASTSSVAKARDFWQRAEKKLYEDETKKKAYQAFLTVLASHDGVIDITAEAGERQTSVSRLLNSEAMKLKQEKTRIRFGSERSVEIRGLLMSVSKKVLATRDLVTGAASSSPPASLACAGGMVCLMLLLQALEHRTTLLKGLDHVCEVMCQSLVIESTYSSRGRWSPLSDEKVLDYETKFEANLVDLYTNILEFHARALCYLKEPRHVRLLQDVFHKTAWTVLLSDIDRLQSQCKTFIDQIDSEKHHREHEALKLQLQNIHDAFFDTIVQQEASKRDEEMKSCLRKLYTCPYESRKNRNSLRVPGTCEWFTNHPLFNEWKNCDQSCMLVVSADPGCGKSVLTRYCVDQALSDSRDRAVCYFFFKDDFVDQRTSSHAASSLLRQLIWQKPEALQNSLVRTLETDNGNFVESFSDLWEAFKNITVQRCTGVEEIVFVLDALDECQDQDRGSFIDGMCDLVRASETTVKFMVTSRPYDYILRRFRRHGSGTPIIRLSGEDEAELDKIAKEIDLVIQSRVHQIGVDMDLEVDERFFLLDQLLSIPHRTYLWVTLTLDVIENLTGFTRGNIKNCITSLPTTVDEAYEKILGRSRDFQKTTKLLHLIVGARRPLSLAEVSLAMVVEEHHQSSIEWEQEPETRFRQTIRDLCGLFVTIIDSKVYLLHQTAREFLVQGENYGNQSEDHFSSQSLSKWKGSVGITSADRVLASVWTKYLSLSDPYASKTALLEYPVEFWYVHFRNANIDCREIWAALAASLCGEMTISPHSWYGHCTDEGHPDPGRTLHIVSFFGIEAAARRLLEDGAEVDDRDDMKWTALCYAAWEGHSQVVFLLVLNGANIGVRTCHGKTPLSLAIEADHQATVEILLRYGADVNNETAVGKALFQAAGEGYSSMISLLLAHGAEIDSQHDKTGRTALAQAIARGKENVVKMSLKHGANTEIRDHEENTALLLAIQYVNFTTLNVPAFRREGVVKHLLTAGAELNAKGNRGRTPLHRAVFIGKYGISAMLIENGADFDAKDHFGRTPLSQCLEEIQARQAQECNSENLLGELKDNMSEKLKEDVKDDDKDSNGGDGEDLSDSSSIATDSMTDPDHAQEAIVGLLLKSGASFDFEEETQRTLLHWAKRNQFVSVIEELQRRGLKD